MSLIAKEPDTKEFEKIEPGTYLARCFQVIDLGTQETQFGPKAKIQIGWEICSEADSQGRPFTVNKQYTNSLFERADLRKDLEAWRGRAFTAEELKGFSLPKLLGAYCFLNIIHTEKNGSTYANISSIMAVPKGTATVETKLPIIFFDLDNFDSAVFEGLNDYLKGKIKQSLEWNKAETALQTPVPEDIVTEEEIPF